MLRLIRVVKARPVKEMLVRFDLEVYQDNRLTGEYSIVLDINRFVELTDITQESDLAPRTNINVEIADIQQELTNQLAGLEITAMIATGLHNMVWDVEVPEGESNAVAEEPANKAE